MAKFKINSPAFVKTVGTGEIPVHYTAGSIIEVSAETPAGRNWAYIEGSGDYTPWQAPSLVAWHKTDVAKEKAAWDARK